MNRLNLFWCPSIILMTLALLSAPGWGGAAVPSGSASVQVNTVTPFAADRSGPLGQITSPIFVPPKGNWSFGEVMRNPKVTYVHFAPLDLDGISFTQHLLDSAHQVQVAVAYVHAEDAGRYQMMLDGNLRPPSGGPGNSQPVWAAAETPDPAATETFSAHAMGTRTAVLQTVGMAITAEVTGSVAARYQALKGGALDVSTNNPSADSSPSAAAGPSLPNSGSVQLINGWLTLDESWKVTAPNELLTGTGDPVACTVALVQPNH